MTPAPVFDVWEELAELVPSDKREAYWKFVAHLKTMHPEDEMLRLCQAIGFLAWITRSVPTELAGERKAWMLFIQQSHALLEDSNRHIENTNRDMRETAIVVRECADEVKHGLQNAVSQVNADTIANAVRQRVEGTIVVKVDCAVQRVANSAEHIDKLVLKAKDSIRFLENLNVGWLWGNAAIFVALMLCVFGALMESWYQDRLKQRIAELNQMAAGNLAVVRQLNEKGIQLEMAATEKGTFLVLPKAKDAYMSTTGQGVILLKEKNPWEWR
jgi:hypothetical protein